MEAVARLGMLLAGLALVATGCQLPAKVEPETPAQVESMLSKAGFQRRDADSAKRRAHLETLQQRTLVGHDQDGQTRWVYADAEGCSCLWVGAQKQYEAYTSMLAGREQTDQAAAARSADVKPDPTSPQEGGNAPMDWEAWGPWDDVPWYNQLEY